MQKLLNLRNEIKTANLNHYFRISSIYSSWVYWFIGSVFSFLFANYLLNGTPLSLNLSYPTLYAGDGLSQEWLIQRVIEGWIFDNPRNGYPFGSNFLDYPGSDAGNLLILKLLGLFTKSYYGAANLYFLLGFPVSFTTSFLVLQRLSIKSHYAFFSSLLFAFAPYHFARWFYGHFFYTWYFMVPIFFFYGFKIAFQPSYLKSWKKKPGLIFILLCLGWFGVYHAFFGSLILVICGIAGIIRHQKLLPFYLCILLSGIVFSGVFLNLLPNLIYQYKNGHNLEVAHRYPVESELYALKLMLLLIPHPDHRIKPFRDFSRNYNQTFPLTNTTSSLGFLGILGLLILIYTFFSTAIGKPSNAHLGLLAIITFILLITTTVGGLNVLFALFITPMIRGWDRISIFIFFCCIFALVLSIQENKKIKFLSAQFPVLSFMALFGLFCLGLLDQTPKTYKDIVATQQFNYQLDSNFIKEIEALVPPASAIYQLPYIPFPESIEHTFSTYTLLGGFLNSKRLKWSHAGMQGRIGDLFYRSLAKQSVEKQLDVIKRLGFTGIYIDRRGFEDRGKALIAKLTLLLDHAPDLIRVDDNVVFFKINVHDPVDLSNKNPKEIMRIANYSVDTSSVS